MSKTRGFVTIATGHERYYVLARNLLYSYRQFASVKYPFALICDKENKYSAEFDDVIFLDNPNCNYLDKLSLYNHLPYDETIFIDADSLAYGDLDNWWRLFENADDFSVFGYAWTDLKCGRGWFRPEGINEFQDKVTFIPDFNGGVYYMRKSMRCKNVFDLANFFAMHYSDYAFTDFITPADEPCLALAMAVNDCKPLDYYEVAFAPRRKQIDVDITKPRAHLYRNKDLEYDVRLVHWSNYRTKLSVYRFEVERLLSKMNGTNQGLVYELLYNKKLRLPILWVWDGIILWMRVWKKAKKLLGDKI